MKLFILETSIESMKQFESFKKKIFKRENNEIVKERIKELLQVINDKTEIEQLANTYFSHFHIDGLDWEMEYDIAKNILKYESQSEKLKYTFELVNYFFTYFFINPILNKSFFLMHGLIVDPGLLSNTLIKEISNNPYVIYKSNQELFNNYLVSEIELNEQLKRIVAQVRSKYQINQLEGIDSKSIFIFQLSSS